jgi:LPXTG-site transpeptidase (sortase) family protein
MSREGRRAKRFRPGARVVLAGTGILAVGGGIGIAVHIAAFYYHSSTAGRALVGQARREISAAAGSSVACQAPPGAAGGGVRGSAAAGGGAGAAGPAGQRPAGLLEVPALGMVAPVLQGTDDSVLDDAVGHDPASVWPGQVGTSVLSAHDVTWFSRIGRLKPGNEVRYVTPCRTYTYKVTSHAIVAAGSPVYNVGTARLVLDTCYPLDALYITSSRYLVYADLTGSAPTHARAAVPGIWRPPAVPAPAKLAAQGLDLAHNPTPLGTLRLTGSPSRAWTQSSAPLQFQAAALAEYFGIIRSADRLLRLAACHHAARRGNQARLRHADRDGDGQRPGRAWQLPADGHRDGQCGQAPRHAGAAEPDQGLTRMTGDDQHLSAAAQGLTAEPEAVVSSAL